MRYALIKDSGEIFNIKEGSRLPSLEGTSMSLVEDVPLDIYPGTHRYNTETGEFESTYDAAADLERYRWKKVSLVNSVIATNRMNYITDIPGQESTYLEKRDEAKRYLAEDPEPATLEDYPFLENAVGLEGDTAYQVCQLWLNMQDIWIQAGSKLEGMRRSAIMAIESAIDKDEIDIAMDFFSQDMTQEGFSA